MIFLSRISPLSLFTLMICGRWFSMMTYYSFVSDNTQVLMLGILISTFFQILLSVPAIKLGKKYSENGLNEKSCKAVTILFFLFFQMIAFATIGNFTYFMDYFFADYIPRLMIVIIFTLSAVYLAHISIRAIGKTAVVVTAVFIFTLVIIIASSFKRFNTVNFNLAQDHFFMTILRSSVREFMRNTELVLFAFLLPSIEGNAGKTLGFYYIVKVCVLEITLAFVTMILGDYGMVSKLPLFSLASYSSTALIERFDASFMFIWVMMAVVKTGAYFHCSGKCIKKIFPKIPFVTSVIISGILPAVFSFAILILHKWEKMAYYHGYVPFVMIIVLFFVVPLIRLIRAGRGEKG